MRTIRDEYELPDDDSDEYIGSMLVRPRRHIARWIVLAAVLIGFAGAAVAAIHVTNQQQQDSFCLGCHTAPEQAYVDRSTSAIAGALAVDLSSYHYQQIHGQGGTIHCIECHQGNSGPNHRFDTLAMSARNALVWLIGRNDPTVEKLRLTEPYLANDSCLNCHQKTLLLAGMANHTHNMLPSAYELWRNGGRLTAPPNTKDIQSVIASGLVRYDTTILCSDCHQTHRTTEADLYLDKQITVMNKCVQCHREVNQGPLEVTVP